MGQTDDFSGTQIPSVFIEPAPAAPPPAMREQAPGISRGFLAIISLVLFGGLVASTAGLMMMRNNEQADWARVRQRLESDRATAMEKAGKLEVVNVRLSADLEDAKAKVQKYGAIEYQLNLVREKVQQIQDLRSAKPSYPVSAYLNVAALPEWSAPGEKLLKEFVAKLDVERAKLIAFKEPKPAGQGPVTPHITPLPTQP